MPSLSSSTSSKRSREWEDYYLREGEWLVDDDIALHLCSNNSEQVPPFDYTREQYGWECYNADGFQRPSPMVISYGECPITFYRSVPSAMTEACVTYILKSKALQILHHSVGHIAPERLQHLVQYGQWRWTHPPAPTNFVRDFQ